MNQKIFPILLDMKAPTAQRDEWEVVEGDNGNVIVITLSDGGVPVDLTGCKVLAVFGLPNGRTVEQDTEEGSVVIGGEHNNEITIYLKTGSFSPGKSNTGLMKSEIQVYSGELQETLVTSAQFTFKCRRSIINNDTIEATDEYPILVELIRQVQELTHDIQSDWGEEDPARPEYIRNKPGSFTPEEHAASHAMNGEDPITPEMIGAAEAGAAPALHHATHGWDGDDPLTPEAIKAIPESDRGNFATLQSNGRITPAQALSSFGTISANRTISDTDMGKVLTTDNAITFTFPSSGVTNGIELEIWNTGSGQVTLSGALFVAGSGDAASATLEPYSVCGVKRMSPKWYITGGVSV